MQAGQVETDNRERERLTDKNKIHTHTDTLITGASCDTAKKSVNVVLERDGNDAMYLTFQPCTKDKRNQLSKRFWIDVPTAKQVWPHVVHPITQTTSACGVSDQISMRPCMGTFPPALTAVHL